MAGVTDHPGNALVRASTLREGALAQRKRWYQAKTNLLQPQGLPWILPSFLLVIGVIYFAIGYTAYISTLNWNGTSPNPTHVGFGNYTQAFHDPVFRLALEHTLLFFCVTFVIQTVIGFGFAVLVRSRIRWATLYKIVIFIPVVIAPASMAPVFRDIFSYTGQFNTLLSAVGLHSLTQAWLAQGSTALPVIMVITMWQWTGLTFILYYAATGQVEREVLEAARLDGCGNLRTIASIIWPNVRGTTVALLILSVIGALKTFDIPWLVTTAGPDYATEFLGTMIYRVSIPQAEVGYGAALSIILLVIAITMAIVISVRANKRTRAAGA